MKVKKLKSILDNLEKKYDNEDVIIYYSPSGELLNIDAIGIEGNRIELIGENIINTNYIFIDSTLDKKCVK